MAGPWGLLLAEHLPLQLQAQVLPPGWLSDSEQQRLAGLRKPRQSLFMACRYALRCLLSVDDGPITDWTLGSAEERGPWIERHADSAAQGMHLSLSHSAGWLACAKAPVPVGVDLEVQASTRQRNVPALSAMVCTDEEQAWLLTQSHSAQQRCFMQLWCLKEAYFKCLGTGVDFSLIRRLTWRLDTDQAVSGGVAGAAQVASALAYARLWQGRTVAGECLTLALCAQQPLPGQALRFPMAEGVHCMEAPTEWVLHAAPEQ